MPSISNRVAQAYSSPIRKLTPFADQAKAEGKLADIRTLLEIIHRPVIEFTNAEGESTYARFILAALHSPVSKNVTSTDIFEEMPIAVHVMELIAGLLESVPPELLAERQRLVSLMLLNSVFSRFTAQDSCLTEDTLIDNALDMAASALQAPVSVKS